MRGGIRIVPFLAAAGVLLSTLPLAAQSPYQDEISIMKRTAAAFERCAVLIEKASTADAMQSALSMTADELQSLFPEMTSVSRAHPDWGNKPPAEVEPTMQLFDASVSRLFEKALPKATAFVNKYPNNEDLQKAFGRVNSILYSQ